MTRAVLFDVDGTLVDTNLLHATAWREAFRHFGVDLPLETIRKQIGKGGDNLIPALLPEPLVERRRKEIEDYRSELFQHEYLPEAVPFRGVRPLFERLYGDGIRIVLATSSKQAELRFHESLIGCEDLIFATASKDDVERSKPCPDIFEAALEKVAPIDKSQVRVVGDSPWDVKAACRAGLATVGVLCGGYEREELREAGAVALFGGPEDLLAHYPGWLGVPTEAA
jgi:HAD superfamily hydrolase (TIGR01509 family)